MKVTKLQLFESKPILEDNDVDDEPIVVDPQEATEQEIAQQVSAASEETSDEEAEKVAQVVKDTAETAEADEAFIATKYIGDKSTDYKNKLVEALNDCLESSIENMRLNTHPFHPADGSNLIICGLPGAGKTSIVKDWASKRQVFGQQLKVAYISANSNNIEDYLNGFTINTTSEKTGPSVGQVYTYETNLGDLNDPDCYTVLFLDEFNRQPDTSLRGNLLTLVKDKAVRGDDKYVNKDGKKTESGWHYFPKLVFSIIAINPYSRNDTGATYLTPAELDRAAAEVDFDSYIDTALDYFYKYGKAEIAKYDRDDKFYDDKVFATLRRMDMELHILKHPLFTDGRDKETGLFGSREEYKDLPKGTSFLSQRSLEGLVDAGSGRRDKTLRVLNRKKEWSEELKKVLARIISEYKDPTYEELCQKYKVVPGDKYKDKVKITPEPETKDSKIDPLTGEEIPDDADINVDPELEDSGNIFKRAGGATGGSTILSTDAAKKQVNDYFDDITFY